MSTRRNSIRIAALLFALTACVTGVGLYSAVLAARAFVATIAMNVLASAIEGIAQVLNVLLAMELIAAATRLATQGPIMAAVWVWSRAALWIGQ